MKSEEESLRNSQLVSAVLNIWSVDAASGAGSRVPKQSPTSNWKHFVKWPFHNWHNCKNRPAGRRKYPTIDRSTSSVSKQTSVAKVLSLPWVRWNGWDAGFTFPLSIRHHPVWPETAKTKHAFLPEKRKSGEKIVALNQNLVFQRSHTHRWSFRLCTRHVGPRRTTVWEHSVHIAQSKRENHSICRRADRFLLLFDGMAWKKRKNVGEWKTWFPISVQGPKDRNNCTCLFRNSFRSAFIFAALMSSAFSFRCCLCSKLV